LCCRSVPEIIDPVFAKTSQNARFLLSENERFGLVFVKTGSINSGTGLHVMKAVKEHAVTVSSGYCDVALVLHPYAITKISTVEPGWCSSRLMLSFWLHQSGWGWEPISRQLCGLKQCHIINYNGYKHTIKGHMRRHTVQKVRRAQSTCISLSSVFRTIDPHPLSTQRSPGGEGVGGQYFGRRQALDWLLTV
jgi:hypothetical protein